MLGRHGRAFAFLPGEIGCVDPTIVESMVIFIVPRVVEPQTDPGAVSSHPEVDGVVDAESGDGHPRVVECPVFKSVVYGPKEERCRSVIRTLREIYKNNIFDLSTHK